MQNFSDRLAALPAGIHRLDTDDGTRLFVKVRRDAPPDFYAAEAHGLSALAATATLRVPQVHAIARETIVMEDLGSGHADARQWIDAGRRLAQLHAARAASFGFDRDGYCGDGAQDNTPDRDGFRFFAERRLLPQARRARDNGLLDAADVARIEVLCARLRERLPARPPVLIHGDLWIGNLHACGDGRLALIDGAAVHHGWAECDLALLILFGEPPPGFFAAYEAESGTDREWRQRAALLNLYHLLNHLNLFGVSYRAALLGVVGRFA